MMSVWDYCNIDPLLVEQFEDLQRDLCEYQAPQDTSTATTSAPSSSSAKVSSIYGSSANSVDKQVQSILYDTNESCRASLESLDSLLLMIQDVKSAFFDVTGRTNSLVHKCETLLDQQV